MSCIPADRLPGLGSAQRHLAKRLQDVRRHPPVGQPQGDRGALRQDADRIQRHGVQAESHAKRAHVLTRYAHTRPCMLPRFRCAAKLVVAYSGVKLVVAHAAMHCSPSLRNVHVQQVR